MGMLPKPGEMKALGTDENIPGGKALKHATFHTYAVHDAKSLKEDVFGFAGNEVRIEMIKCKSFTPYIPISIYFNFVSGFNRLWSLYGALKDAKLIQMKGGWAGKIFSASSTFVHTGRWGSLREPVHRRTLGWFGRPAASRSHTVLHEADEDQIESKTRDHHRRHFGRLAPVLWSLPSLPNQSHLHTPCGSLRCRSKSWSPGEGNQPFH